MTMQNQGQGGVPQGGVPGGPAAKKKFPWLWVLGGCGCLTVVLLLALVVVGFLVVRKSSDTWDEVVSSYGLNVSEDGPSESTSGKAKKSTGTSKGSAQAKNSKETSKDALDPAKIREYMSKPLTKAEVNAFHKSSDTWKKNKAYVEYEKNLEEMKKLDGNKNKSTVEQMRAVRNVGKLTTSLAKLAEAFDEHIGKQGGYEEHYSRVLRIAGAIAATEMMARQHKLEDKHSDEAIALVLKEQPEIAAEYKKGLDEAQKAAAANNEVGMETYLAVMSGGPGAVAMARMPASTFKTWQSLSPAERKKAEEDLQHSLGFSGYIGLAINPAALFQMAMMSEFNEISGK